MNLEFNSTCRRKKHSLFHLKYIDFTRSTHADLDVLQEKRVDDYWNVDWSKHLSDSWRGFKKFTLLKEKPQKGYMCTWRRLTKIQATTRPDQVWPEVWTKIGKAAQNREKLGMGKREAEARQCSKTERNLLYWSICKFSKSKKGNWKDLWHQPRCGQGMEKTQDNPVMELGKSQEQKGAYPGRCFCSPAFVFWPFCWDPSGRHPWLMLHPTTMLLCYIGGSYDTVSQSCTTCSKVSRACSRQRRRCLHPRRIFMGLFLFFSGVHDFSFRFNMECDGDIRKNLYVNFRPSGGTARLCSKELLNEWRRNRRCRLHPRWS